MSGSSISRRALLLSAAAGLGCGRRKATAFPGYCFVANQESRSVAAVDLSTFRVVKHIPLEAAPASIVAHPDAARSTAYVFAPEAGAVYEIDSGSLSVSRRAHVGGQASDMRLSPAGDALWVLRSGPSSLVRIPLDTLKPGKRIQLPGHVDSFELSSTGLAAAASREGKTIALVSLSRGSVERTIQAGLEPSLVAFRSDGEQLIAGSTPDRALIIFDVASGKRVVRLPLPVSPRRFCFKKDGGELFITGDGMDAVVIAFPFETEIEQTILAGHAPGAMAVSETPAYLFVANPGSNSVTVMDIDTRRMLAVVRVGQSPGAIRITPDGQYALILNEASGDLAVVRLRTFSEAWVRRYKSASLFTLIPVGQKPVSAAVVQVG